MFLKKQIFDNVEGAVQVESQEESECTETRCVLECVERVRKNRRVYNAPLKREVEQQVWDSAVMFSARPQLAGARVPEGFVQSYRFKILIPPGAQPSFKSLDRVVAWNLKGVAAVEGRPDAASKTVEIQVSPPSRVQHALSTVSCKHCGTVFLQGRPSALTATRLEQASRPV